MKASPGGTGIKDQNGVLRSFFRAEPQRSLSQDSHQTFLLRFLGHPWRRACEWIQIRLVSLATMVLVFSR